MGPGKTILMNLCGRGDKDMIQVAQRLGFKLMADEGGDGGLNTQ